MTPTEATPGPVAEPIVESVARRHRGGPTPGRIILVTVAAVLFLALALHARSGRIWAAEWAVTDWFVAHRTPTVTSGARGLSTITEPIGVLLIALAVGGALSLRRRHWHPLAVALAATGLAAVAIAGLKAIVARPRPPASLHLITENDHGFPSGHALGTMTVFLTLAWLVAKGLGRPATALAYGVALLVALLVAASRLYLGVHWVTDVIAGWAVAAILLTPLAEVATRPDRGPPGASGSHR